MKQKILVCGATGFIGRNIAERLARRDDVQLHLARFSRPEYKISNATWHQADLRDPNQTNDLISGMDIVIQAAATTSGVKDIVTRPHIHVTDNAVMNSYIFRSCADNKIKRVVFFSCTIMYSSSTKALKETDFDANAIINERYFGAANTKLYAEKMCEFFAKTSDTVYTVIRHSNIYGPYDKYDLDRSHVFGASITKVLTENDKVVIWGSGDEERDLLHVDDLCDFVQVSLEKQPAKFRIYNCGSGTSLSIRNLIIKMIKHSGKKLNIEYNLSQPTIKTSLFLDCELAKYELSWRQKIFIDDGIIKTIKWWRENIDPETFTLIE